jgi:Uncharacterised nucleotidyltransferase
MAAQLQQTLREVTELLAGELTSPSPQAPEWSDFQWTAARAVAAIHGVSPLLSTSLNWRGPPKWCQFLESQWRHTALRHIRICDLLQHIDSEARVLGIPVLALKGVALNDLGLYSAGERPMADIDLLVEPRDAAPLGELLRSMDYELSSANWREAVYVPIGVREPAAYGEHANNAVKIEVHERIAERLPWRVTDVTSHIFPAQPRSGLNPYDSKAALMTHLLLHAAGSMSRQSLRLLQLHDVAQLASKMSLADWQEFERDGSAHGWWWAFPPFRMAYRYYPKTIPTDVLAHLAERCPLWLRVAAARASLYDVSLSYPWVDAFPALVWARSPAELLEYIANRLRPPANLIAARQRTVETEPWARSAAWGRLPQGRRMLRWAMARQTRPATLHALAAAFAAGEAPAASA